MKREGKGKKGAMQEEKRDKARVRKGQGKGKKGTRQGDERGKARRRKGQGKGKERNWFFNILF